MTFLNQILVMLINEGIVLELCIPLLVYALIENKKGKERDIKITYSVNGTKVIKK